MDNAVALKEQTSSAVEMANTLIIKDSEGVKEGQVYIKGLRDLKSKVLETFDPLCAAAHITHKQLTATRGTLVDPLVAAEKVINGKIGTHMMAVEAENRRIQAEAEAKARKEHDDALRAAGARIKALTKQTSSISQQIATLEGVLVAHGTSAVEVEALRAEIAVLNGKLGNKVEAMQEQEAIAEEAPVPVVAPVQETKFDGMAMVKTMTVEVVEPTALIAAIAAGTVPDSVIKWDMAMIKKLAKAGVKMPGVKTEETKTPRHSNTQGM